MQPKKIVLFRSRNTNGDLRCDRAHYDVTLMRPADMKFRLYISVSFNAKIEWGGLYPGQWTRVLDQWFRGDQMTCYAYMLHSSLMS